MDVLVPAYAARLADDVYLLNDAATQLIFMARHARYMEIAQARMASGVTGGYILKKPHAMAVLSAGKGDYAGQAFAIFMGTADLYDVLTDLNTGVTASHTGLPVHQGFYRAFDSVLPELRQFVTGLRGITQVHCVGHSLGGALATLAADWLRAADKTPRASAYTFGCPRIGLSLFAEKCTERVQMPNFYRAFHQTDPIPMLPTWPFYHVPQGELSYLLASPVAPRPWEYHLMAHYLASVKDAVSWDALQSARPPSYGEAAIQQWLTSEGLIALTASTLGLLNAALQFVLEKAAQATGIALVGGFAASFTLLDRMAMLLAQAAPVITERGDWVRHLIRKLGALVDVVVNSATTLTIAFIRMVFLKLHQKITDMVRQIARSLP